MTPNPPSKPRPADSHSPKREDSRDRNSKSIDQAIIITIGELKPGLKDYPIRQMVEDAAKFGPFLRKQRLETNQIRKFLDAINRLKAKIATGDDVSTKNTLAADDKSMPQKTDKQIFAEIEPDIVLLKPKLAYAAARQKAAKPLSDVMAKAIDKVHSLDDFKRLVQLLESIIAYHKAEGGR